MSQTNSPSTPDRSASIASEARLLDEHEAARLLALKVSTLRRWRWSGDGPPHYKIGNAVRYALPDLSAFIEAGRRTSTSDAGPQAAEQ